MKALRLLGILCIMLFSVVDRSFCYEVSTHEEITKNALEKALQVRNFLADIGYTKDDRITFTFTTYDPYGDLSGNNGTFTNSIIEWMKYGSNVEDNTISETLFRYRNHFYDPVYNRGYQYGVLTGEKAPDWALEDNGSYSLQYWSIPHAKSYYLAALTSSTKTEKDNNLAKTFKALGHVIHTVEDMAQPQHTRNDSHGTGSQYEKQLVTYPPSNYTPSYMPSFSSYRGFYFTGDGKGLAEFSNRSFVTEGTNFNCTNLDLSNPSSTCLNAYYSNPVLSVYLKEEVQIADLLTELGMSNSNNLSGVVTFFGNSIADAYSGETFENSRMTTYSIFDKDLINKGSAPTFTLNRANYNEMAKILLPRAVGYSAGLLNYFFRGQINMEKDPDNPGQYIIKNESSERMEGTFTLYYDDTNDNRREVANWSLSINANDKSGPVSFTAPTSPEPDEYGKYILVFNGKLGNEEGAAVGREITEQTNYGRVVSVSNYYGSRGNITVYTKNGTITGKLPSTGLSDVRAVRFDIDDWNTFVVLAVYYDYNDATCKNGCYDFHKYSIDENALSLNYQGVVLQEGPISKTEETREMIFERWLSDVDEGTYYQAWNVQENRKGLYYTDFFLKSNDIKPFGNISETNITYLYELSTNSGINSKKIMNYKETYKLYYGGVVQEKTPFNCQGGCYYFTESGNPEVVACQPQEPQDTYFVPLAVFNSSDYAYALYQYQFTGYFAGQPQYSGYQTNVVSTLPIAMPQDLKNNTYLKTMLREEGKYSFYNNYPSKALKSYSSEIGVAGCSGFLITDTQVGDGYLGWQSSGKIVSFENCSDWQPLGRTGSGGDKFDVILNYR